MTPQRGTVAGLACSRCGACEPCAGRDVAVVMPRKSSEARRSRRVVIGCQPREAVMLRAIAHACGESVAEVVRGWINARWDEDVLARYEAHVARLPRDRKPWRKRA